MKPESGDTISVDLLVHTVYTNSVSVKFGHDHFVYIKQDDILSIKKNLPEVGDTVQFSFHSIESGSKYRLIYIHGIYALIQHDNNSPFITELDSLRCAD